MLIIFPTRLTNKRHQQLRLWCTAHNYSFDRAHNLCFGGSDTILRTIIMTAR